MRILIAEDDFTSRMLLDAVLVKLSYEVVAANDGETAAAVLEADDAPLIAIVDWMMPKLSGVELCRRVRAQKRELEPYILMLTARGQKCDVAEGLDAGADDYLVKPFDLTELSARLRVARRSVEQQQALLESRQAVQYQTEHDVSTGALNRATVLQALEERLSAAQPFSILLVALDRHKQLQQSEGAEAAEAAVRGLARELRAKLPEEALIGRYGVDELLVILPGAALATAVELAERGRAAVAEPLLRQRVGVDAELTASFGVAEWDGQGASELLLCYADTALYAARAAGNAVDVFGVAPEIPRSHAVR